MARKPTAPVPPAPPPPKPPQAIDREAIDAVFGGEEGLDAAIKAYTLALAAHAKTTGVAAPTTHPWVELIVRQHGGAYTVVEPPPVPEPAKAEEPVVEAAAEPAPPTLDEVKSTVLKQISDLKHKKTRAGVSYKGYTFYGDAMSVNAIVAVVVAGLDEGNFVIRWKAKGGEFAELEKIDFTILLKLLRKNAQACFDAEYALRQRVIAAADIKALQKIDYNVGWPE